MTKHLPLCLSKPAAPVGDSVLQAVVDCWTIFCGAVLAAEEAAVVLLVHAPALEALALVLLCNSNGVDELDVGVPAPMTSRNLWKCSCQWHHLLQCSLQAVVSGHECVVPGDQAMTPAVSVCHTR